MSLIRSIIKAQSTAAVVSSSVPPKRRPARCVVIAEIAFESRALD
jgi:hypothetical protein